MSRDSNPLRILVVSQNFPQRQMEWSGEFLVRLARALVPHGVECSFIVPRPWAPWPLVKFGRWARYGPQNPLLRFEGIRSRIVTFFRPPGAWFFPYEGRSMIASVLRLARLWHAESSFDVILGVQLAGEGCAAVEVGGRLGIPSAVMAIGTDLLVLPKRIPRLRRRLVRTLEKSGLPIVVSQDLVREMATYCESAAHRAFLARLPRDASSFRPAGDRSTVRRALHLSDEDVVLLYVGRLEKAKGLAELCEVLPRLIERHGRLRVVCLGDGSYRDRLSRVGRRRPGTVRLPGRVPPDEVPRYMQASDMLVLPSHSEGLPQVVLEAMNCGLPVIATDVGGISEAVEHEVTGLLVPCYDLNALEAAIDRMTADASLRAAMGRRGFERARDHFDSEVHTRRFADALRSLARG